MAVRHHQSRFHPVARCPAWDDKKRVTQKRILRLCKRRGPVVPSVGEKFGDKL